MRYIDIFCKYNFRTHVHFPTLTIIASNKMRNNSLHHAERLKTILTALKSDKFFESFLDIWE